MSNNRPKPKRRLRGNSIERAYTFGAQSGPMGIQGDYAKYAQGSVMVPMNILSQMIQNLAPQKNQAKDFAPGSPLTPYVGVVPQGGPRQFSYPTGTNISNNDRSLGGMLPDEPTFAQLRALALSFDGIGLCERVILDMIPKLKPQVSIVKELAKQGMKEADYQDEIAAWRAFIDKPSPAQNLDIHSWLRMAWTEQTQIDALAIFKHKTRGGGLYGLEILDGSLVKPILNERGMIPDAAQGFPAYQQYPYGIPGDLYTTDQMLYYRESPRSFTPYGLSRVQRIILRVNQALRKQQKDLSRYTAGNVPAGIMEVPESLNWTPDQIDSYEQMWNALMTGNIQKQVQVKFTQPGMKYTPLDDLTNSGHLTEFDEFLLNVAAACYGLSMGDLAFTASIHKSADEGQQNMMFRRTLYPLVAVYARLLTMVRREYSHCNVLEYSFGGFEEPEDVAAQAAAYSTFAGIGAISPAGVARAMNFPEVPETGPLLITKSGITPLASFEIGSDARQAQDAAQLAGLQLAAQGQSAQANGQSHTDESEDTDDEDDQDSKPAQDAQSGSGKHEQASKNAKAGAGAARTARDAPANDALRDGIRGRESRGSVADERIARTDSEQHTGVMIAFFLDRQAATQLALPGGEPAQDLHVTLAFLGDKADFDLDLATLKRALASFASEAMPLEGQTGGLGRFTPSDSSDGLSPVIALVNVKGLQAWRARLVQCLDSIGVQTANDFEYQPHITLQYIDVDAPLPVESISTVPLVFDTLWLCIGDERYPFNVGDEQYPAYWEHKADERVTRADLDTLMGRIEQLLRETRQHERSLIDESRIQPTQAAPGRDPGNLARGDRQTTTGTPADRLAPPDGAGPDRAGQWRRGTCPCAACRANDGVVRQAGMPYPSGATAPGDHATCDCHIESVDERAISAEYRRWRERACDDIKAGKALRGFTTTLIPGEVHQWITGELARCTTVEDVRAVFTRARDMAIPDSGAWQQGDPQYAAILDQWREQGVVETEWDAGGSACDQCMRNHGQRRALGQPYPTGALMTPNHDHCQCVMRLIRADGTSVTAVPQNSMAASGSTR